MKKTLLFTLLLFVIVPLKAQESFFPTKEGTVLIYKMFDKKNKETGTMKYTIKEIVSNGDDMDVTYIVESMDPKGKSQFKEEITMYKKGDVLYYDMGNFINKAAFQQDGEIPPNIQITGNNMEIPVNPTPGQSLPDANIEIALKMAFVNLKISTSLTNRKVEAVEDITVPAGSFNCYKFTSDVNSSIMGKKITASSVEWYARGLGVVKSESYNKKGELETYMVLVEKD